MSELDSYTRRHTGFYVGYNLKQSSKNGQINCQLTHTGDQTFERISTEDNDWMFYKTKGEKMVSILKIYFSVS